MLTTLEICIKIIVSVSQSSLKERIVMIKVISEKPVVCKKITTALLNVLKMYCCAFSYNMSKNVANLKAVSEKII